MSVCLAREFPSCCQPYTELPKERTCYIYGGGGDWGMALGVGDREVNLVAQVRNPGAPPVAVLGGFGVQTEAWLRSSSGCLATLANPGWPLPISASTQEGGHILTGGW